MSLFRDLLIDKRKRRYYCEVEYLEASGTQYINTGLLSTAQSKVDVVYGFSNMASGATNNCAIFGGRSSSTYTVNTFTMFKLASASPQAFRFDYNTQKSIATASNMAWNTTSKYRMTYNGSRAQVTNITTGETAGLDMNPAESYTTTPIAIFAVNTMGAVGQNMKGRIYKFWYTDGTNTVDLIPVLDWNLTPCMYDRIGDKFFYNAGTGSFTYGREIHYVDYLEADGTQYIDTGVYLTNNHSVEIDYQLTVASQSRKGLYGGLATSRHGALLSPSNQYLEAGYGAGNDYYQLGLPDTNRHTFKQEKNKLYFDGVLTHTFNTAIFTQNFTAPLGNFNYTNYTPASAKYYSSKWWENTTLIRDYKPAIDENGVGYMFDGVTHSCFLNAGTGDFKYPARQTEYLQTTAIGANIDLGIKYKSSMSIKLKYMRDSQGDSGSVLPLSNNTTPPLIYFPALNASAKTDRFVWRRTGYTEQRQDITFTSYPMADQEIYLDAVNDKLYINDTEVKSGMIAGMGGYTSPYESSSNLQMLSINGSYCGLGKIYYVQLYDTTQVYRDLVPAWKDGQFGMYDKENDVLYQNNKTAGTIVSGKIVESKYE